jgi:hypothetical protein
MRGYRVLDEVGAKVGRVDEVWDDWLLVQVGRFGDVYTLVPAEIVVTAGGYAWVPCRIDRILATAPLARGGRPSERVERELKLHYGLPSVARARG